MRTIVVGDVHGCIDELRALLDTLQPRRTDHLVFAGDLLDKGPHSPEVVAEVRALRDSGHRVTLVLGNHEEKHARFRRRQATRADVTVLTGWEEMSSITARLTTEDVAFLETAVLAVPLPEHGAMVVHAGVLPGSRTLPTTVEGLAALPRDARQHALLACRVRYVNPRGALVPLGNETPGDRYWASVYDGRFGHIYFGHNPFDGDAPQRFPQATGLDLGCVFGGFLCAAVLEPGSPPRAELVRAARAYATARAM